MNTETILRALGFDVVPWQLEGSDTLQITDKAGVTFYMGADCSVASALDRYQQKLKDFAVNQ